MDQGQLRSGDRDAILAVLASFDSGLLRVRRTAKRRSHATGFGMGRADRPAERCCAELLTRQGLTDAAIDALVAERTQAKKQRNFARADQIRNELAGKGIVLEDSKDGVRWKRK